MKGCCLPLKLPLRERKCQARRQLWSELPQELIRSIAALLEQDSFALRQFRMVCKKWHRSTALSAVLPHRINTTPHLHLSSSSVYLLRPSSSSAASTPPWMVSAVESTTKGTLHFSHPFTRLPIPNLPGNLTPNEFRSSKLAAAYHLSYKSNENGQSFDKVLVTSSKYVPSIEDCSVLVLHEGGRLSGYNPSFAHYPDYDDGLLIDQAILPWIEISNYFVKRFDDVVTYRGMIVALDQHGKLYQIHDHNLEMNGLFLDDSVPSGRGGVKWRKRLVGTPEGKLYLVVRENGPVRNTRWAAKQPLFKVYELSYSSGKLGKWVRVKGFKGLVLFVARDYCFFVGADVFPGCQLRNCMVYSDDSFPQISETCWVYPDREGVIAVFRFDGPGGGKIQPLDSYPGFPMSMWSAPSWISMPHTSTLLLSQRELDEEEDEATMQIDSNTQDSETHHEEEEVEAATMHFDLNNQGGTSFQGEVTPPHAMNGARHEVGEGSRADTREETIHSVTRAYTTSSSASDASTVQFKGFNISSTLVATLQNIWSKHGNVVRNSIIRNGEILARSLESLANMVRILKDSTNGSLDDSVADYLSTTLSDLQHMHFEVDWLVPFVKKALDYHKSKPLVDSLKELGHAKAKTREMRSKLGNDLAKVDEMEREVKARAAEMRSELDQKLAKLDEVEKELEQDITVLSETIPFSGELNFDELV